MGFFGNEDSGRVSWLDGVDQVDDDSDRQYRQNRRLHRGAGLETVQCVALILVILLWGGF